MDFFDPQKQKSHAIRLAVGYALMGVMLILATVVLLYQAYGFGLDKEGRIIQNGLVFVSSHPESASVYVNNKKYKDGTNTRMNLPSGQYVMELKRSGYHDWKRVLTVEGGSVERFDYPFLFPSTLKTNIVKKYDTPPLFSTQSIDHRWLLVSRQEQNAFDLYDLNAREPSAQSVTIPSEVLAAGSTSTGWQLVEWAKDNRHAVFKRMYNALGQAGSEYILFDRETPELSQNLSVILGFNPTALELRDQAYDRYYAYDQAAGQLFTASLKNPTPVPYISGVLAFTSEGDIVAYVTDRDAASGKVIIRVKQNNDASLAIRQVPAGTTYPLDMAIYEDSLYLAVGAASENRVFLFKDPIGTLKAAPKDPLTPIQILKVVTPNHVSFSANNRFVIAENADKFAVYDTETDRGYAYQAAAPMDAPQTSATWMDGFRLSYVSGGKIVVFDFDGTNMQSLATATPGHLPIFSHDYRFLYALSGQNELSTTALLTPEDL
jgi:hypothetical protein